MGIRGIWQGGGLRACSAWTASLPANLWMGTKLDLLPPVRSAGTVTPFTGVNVLLHIRGP